MAIHIHEDDWGLRSVFPLSALKSFNRDLNKAINSSRENLSESGAGWTEMQDIREPQENYLPLNISLTEVEPMFAQIMPRVRKFSATQGSYIGSSRRDPWGSYEDDAWCFGLDSKCYIHLQACGGFLRSICYEYDGSPDCLERMRSAFAVIEGIAPSVLVDYNRDVCVPLADDDMLGRYLDFSQ